MTSLAASLHSARFPGALRRVLLSLAVFCAAFAVGLLAVGLVRDRQLEAQRRHAATVASTVAASLETELSHALSTTYALAAHLRLTGFDEEHFDEVADDLLGAHGMVDSLLLAPGGIVARAHPPGPAEALIGHDLLSDARLRAASSTAITSGQLAVSGPLALTNGEQVILGELPVFRDASGGRRFWGLVVATVPLGEALAAAQLDRLPERGYRYVLSRVAEGSAHGAAIIASSDDEAVRDPVRLRVSLPNEQWLLALTPAEGWEAATWPLHSALIALTSALLALLVFVSLRHSEAVAYLAFHDPLTGLSNRVLLPDRFQQAMARARRARQYVAVLLLDLDGFKQVNDGLGHAAGDRVLSEVARRLRAAVRDADTLVRLGGDEFVLIAPDLQSPGDWEPIAQKLLDAVAPPIALAGTSRTVTASIGASLLTAGGATELDELLAQADTALYEAKRAGKATFRLHSVNGSEPPGEEAGEVAIERARVREQPVADHPRGHN